MGKCKKSKKDKKSNRRSSSSSSDSEYGWAEQGKSSQNDPMVSNTSRTDSTWMNEVDSLENFMDQFTSKSDKLKFQKPHLNDQPGASLNELNPYWKEGGSGVPVQKSTSKSSLTQGNRSWLYKSYLHCVDQAKQESVDLKELLLQRWDEVTVDDMLEQFGQLRDFHGRNRSRFDNDKKKPRWRKTDGDALGRDISSSTHPQSSEPDEELTRQRWEEPSTIQNPQPSQTSEMEERLVTNEDINSMAAKVMKAELTGNSAKVDKLNANLEKLREAQRRGIKVRMHVIRKQPTTSGRASTITLTRLNDRGVEMPVSIPNLPADKEIHPKSGKRFQSHDSAGQRIAYFSDDLSGKTLTDLVREEQFRSAQDMEEEFTKLAGKSGRHVDDEYADAFISKRDRSSREAQRVKQDAVAAYKRRAVAQSSCTTCLERVPKHLVVSVGEKVFLSLPERKSMVPGHCLLTPFEHIGSTTLLDESTIRELIEFKRQLVNMCTTQFNGSDCVFLETAKRPDSAKAHVQLECIPVPCDIVDSVPTYFKKALTELGSEWDQNRRVIHLKPNRMGAHGSIPPKFGYFAVDFGKSGSGFARVLDDGRDISSHFGREILGGILDLDPHLWRKPKNESFDHLREKVVGFETWWSPYDKWSDRHPQNFQKQPQSDEKSPSPEGPDLPPGF